MPIISLQQHNALVEDLAKEVESCTLEVSAAEEKVAKANDKLAQAKRLHKMAIELRAYEHPPTELTSTGSTASPVTSVKPTGDKIKRRTLEDYIHLLVPFLQAKGSSHFKTVHEHIQKVTGEAMSVDQIYRALVRIASDPNSPIENDMFNKTPPYTRGGYFRLRTKGGASSQEGVPPSTESKSVGATF